MKDTETVKKICLTSVKDNYTKLYESFFALLRKILRLKESLLIRLIPFKYIMNPYYSS